MWQQSSGAINVGANLYEYAVNAFKYITTNPATLYSQDTGNGIHTWSTAASGTAGNVITFSERMRIDSSGNVSIGTTSSTTKLYVAGSAASNNYTLTDAATITPDFSQSNNFTITLGGNLTTSGAHATTLTTTGTTTVTLPTSGTLAINGPAFAAYANATLQTITSGSQQKVLFQAEEFDTNSNFASSRFTPTVAGYYQLNAEVRLDGTSGTGEMMIVLYKNGSEYKRGTNQQGTQIAANFWAMQVSSLAYANGSTDYFEIYVQQGSGADRTITAVNNPAITWFNGCMVSGA
jgi:hypothetical protein